jgi:hypothetical protein
VTVSARSYNEPARRGTLTAHAHSHRQNRHIARVTADTCIRPSAPRMIHERGVSSHASAEPVT